MAYEKQTWNTGDIITADKLNHMEDGIDGILVVTITDTVDLENPQTHTITGDYTYAEISAAIDAGKDVILKESSNNGISDSYWYYRLLEYVSTPNNNLGRVRFYKLSWAVNDDDTSFSVDALELLESTGLWYKVGVSTFFS